MTKQELYLHPGWKWCTSEGSELHTLLLGLETTFEEKLEWLEEAETLSLMLHLAPPRKSEDREPMTEDSGQKSEDRQRT